MTEYKLIVKDNPDPMSRLPFLNLLEGFLSGLKEKGIIQGYSLQTPYGATTIFKVKEEAKCLNE